MGSLLLLLSLAEAALAVLVAETRPVRRFIGLYALQGLLIALTLLLSAVLSHQHALMGAALTILIAKACILPWLLLRFARATGAEELSTPPSGYAGAVAAAVLGFAAGQFGLTALLSGVPGVATNVPYGLGAGLSAIAVALWTVLAHRDTFKVATGICLLENGAHLLLAAIAPTIPEIASVGIILDVILAVWLLLLVGRLAEEATGDRSDGALDQLRG